MSSVMCDRLELNRGCLSGTIFIYNFHRLSIALLLTNICIQLSVFEHHIAPYKYVTAQGLKWWTVCMHAADF